MPLSVWFALALALFFAMNIGASGTAASMAEAYGGGSLTRRASVFLAALFALAGAALGGGNVIRTLGGELLAAHTLTLPVATAVIGAAAGTLFAANLLRIPLSTSEVTVGALAGAGLALGGLDLLRLRWIVLSWIVLPACSGALAYGFGRYVFPHLPAGGRPRAAVHALLIATGCYQAFAAGTNNVANAVGPLVGTGLLSSRAGALLGGIFLALGAAALGGRVLETNGKRITRLCPIQGAFIAFVSGSLVLCASYAGLPVPLTQVTTLAIVGMGWGKPGPDTLQWDTVRRIVKVWVLSPVLSLAAAVMLVSMLDSEGLGARAPLPASAAATLVGD